MSKQVEMKSGATVVKVAPYQVKEMEARGYNIVEAKQPKTIFKKVEEKSDGKV